MSFLKAQVIFPSNFASIFSAIKHNSSILFLAQTLYTLVKSSLLKCKLLRFSTAWVKICQIPHVNFELSSQLFSKFCIILHCHDTKLPCKFYTHKFSTRLKDAIKAPIWKLSNALVKICQIPHVNFWKHKSVFLQTLYQS